MPSLRNATSYLARYFEVFINTNILMDVFFITNTQKQK